MDPAPAVARRGAEHVDERGDVVVGDLLALLDGLDGERRGADRLEILGAVGPSISSHAATSTLRQASIRASSVQTAPMARPCVALDHALMMRTARCAALRGLSSPTRGDRHARRHLDHAQDRVEPAGGAERRRQRDADHRQVGVRRGHARQRRAQARAGDDHLQPALARGAAVLRDLVGVAVRRHDAHLEGASASSSTLPAFSMVSMSDLEPMMIPTSGPSGSGSSSSLGCRSGLRLELGHAPLAPRPAARCRGAAGGPRIGSGRRQHRQRRGRRRGRPQRRDVEHAPAGGDELAVAQRGARVGDLDVGGTSSRR